MGTGAFLIPPAWQFEDECRPFAGAVAVRGKPTPQFAGRQRTAVQAESDRKSTRLNSSHLVISYAVFCLKKKKITTLSPISLDEQRRAAIQYLHLKDSTTALRSDTDLYDNILRTSLHESPNHVLASCYLP